MSIDLRDGRIGEDTLNFLSTRLVTTFDPTLAISPLQASQAEGNAGTRAFTFLIARSGDTTGVSSAQWTLLGSGTNPTDSSDFSGPFSGTISFAPGQSSRTLTVNVAGDTSVEPNESFKISLSDPSPGTTLGNASASGTISNDDTSLAIAPLAASKAEGLAGPRPFTFIINRTGKLSATSSVRWSAAGTGSNPTNGADFSGPTSGTLTFAPNQTSRTLTISVNGDTLQEANETFSVNLSAPSAATLATASAAATILNDDLIGDGNPNTLNGSDLSDFIDGRANLDTLTGGANSDVFGFRFSQSSLTAPDRITDFAFGSDKIDLFSPTGAALPAPARLSRAANNSTADTLASLTSALFADANGALAGNQALAANSAVLVQASHPAIAGTYLLINNANASRSNSDDLLIHLSGFTGSLPPLGAINTAQVFL